MSIEIAFPTIATIDDVLPYVDKKYFIVADRGDYTIINYAFSSEDTFPNIDKNNSTPEEQRVAKMRREFRGITFSNRHGGIIRRPFHKFFNIAERPETHLSKIPLTLGYEIMEKIDGTMICPFFPDGYSSELIWGTKMGETEYSHDVKEFVKTNPEFQKFAEDIIMIHQSTPIFEFTSPRNRVVVDYGPNPALKLIAIREMHTGVYFSEGVMKKIVNQYDGIPVAEFQTNAKFDESFLEHTKKAQNIEGFCIRVKNNPENRYAPGFVGEIYKVKSETYCQLHRVKSDIQTERAVVELILAEKLDDLKPVLLPDDLKKITEYEAAFLEQLSRAIDLVHQQVQKIKSENMSRKHFAIHFFKNTDTLIESIIFKLWDTDFQYTREDITEHLKKYIMTQTIKQSKFEAFKKTEFFKGMQVTYDGVNIDG